VVPGVTDIDPQLINPMQLELFDRDNILRCLYPELRSEPPPPRIRSGRHPWAWLRRRVFGDEMQVCPRCQGQMRIKEVADDPVTITAEMARLGLAPMPPPKPLPSPPAQLRLQLEGYN
jgi:hypothetical protein